MKSLLFFQSALVCAGGLISGTSAFLETTITHENRHYGYHEHSFSSSFIVYSSMANSYETFVDIEEGVPREISVFQEWAANCGVQTAEGFQLVSSNNHPSLGGGEDISVMTSQPIAAGSPILFVPSQMIVTSSTALTQEFGPECMPFLQEKLVEAGFTDPKHLSLFALFVKILVEYQKGSDSPYYPWLNALPRQFTNGVSMTYACFDCLPPYVSKLAKQQRSQFKQFHNLLPYASQVGILDGMTLTNRPLVKWAYCVALTRSLDDSNSNNNNQNAIAGEKPIVPMADFFNHGADPEVQLNFDADGNCMAYAIKDIPANSPLRISLGDPTNPSPLFATYGFLDDSATATFCKLLGYAKEMKDLGYNFSNLLFYKDGNVSPEVYDILLYRILRQSDEDPSICQGFLEACWNANTETKNSYHNHYIQYTLGALQQHVDTTLKTLDTLSERARGYDRAKHPRVPIILAHNDFVKQTFLRVKGNVDAMMAAQSSQQ